jgi:hypothetical protein
MRSRGCREIGSPSRSCAPARSRDACRGRPRGPVGVLLRGPDALPRTRLAGWGRARRQGDGASAAAAGAGWRARAAGSRGSHCFGGPGARDAFELVLRAVTGDPYTLDLGLARPERRRAAERFRVRAGLPRARGDAHRAPRVHHRRVRRPRANRAAHARAGDAARHAQRRDGRARHARPADAVYLAEQRRQAASAAADCSSASLAASIPEGRLGQSGVQADDGLVVVNRDAVAPNAQTRAHGKAAADDRSVGVLSTPVAHTPIRDRAR